MDDKELSMPAFSVTRDPAGLRINVPVKTEKFRTLLNLVWLLVWAVGEVVVLTSILGGFGTPEVTPSVALPVSGLFLGALTLAGGVVLWRWLWCMGGQETFLITREALLVRREIWGIGRSRRFAYGKIRSLKASRLSYGLFYPSWGRMFIGHDGSEIVIDYAGLRHSYGKGLEDAEARELAGLLEEEMKLPFPRRSLPWISPSS